MSILTSLPTIVHVSTLSAESSQLMFTSYDAGWNQITKTTVTTAEYRFITKSLAESTASGLASDVTSAGVPSAPGIKYTRTVVSGAAQRAGPAGNYTCTKTTTVMDVYWGVRFDLSPS